MVLIISIVGSIICFQALPYMKNHETHLHLTKTGQHRFFFVMILFLGAMNGLVLSNDMLIFYFFFEVTTLCSFLLIGHDETETAIKNAVRALWMNSLGEIGVKVKGRPEGETVARTEQPHGELLYYIKADGSKNLDRLRIRTPSFANIPALVTMLPGQYLSDVPVIVLSIDPCISCTER
jgi:hypothetical protein